MIFSDEVWLIILENLSIPELVKLRLVSHCFKELAEYVLKRHPGWEDLAKKNMQIEWLEDVMVKACPYDLISHQNEIHDPALWRKTYLSYINWQKILVKADVTFNKVPPSNFGYIVYTTTFDKYLLLVFGNNVIEIYTFVDDDPFRLLFKFQMNNYVPQAEFWQSNGDLLVVFQDRDSSLTFWDINKKIKITNNGCSSTRISRNGCRDFCIGENNGIITSFERDGNIISPGQSINLKLTEDQEVLIHTVHTNYLSILVYVHNAVILYNYKVMINNGMVAGFQFIDTTGPMRLIHPLNKWANFTILNTDYLYVTNDFNGFATNYHLEDHDLIHFYTPSRWGNVMSAAMHAHLVILGCQNGSIRLFSIEDTSEMMALYGDPANILYSRNIRTIKASNRPIFYLNFWEFEDKIFIVAVTDETISRLMNLRILECESIQPFNYNLLLYVKRNTFSDMDHLLHCFCYQTNVAVRDEQLSSYAGCKLLEFKVKAFRRFVYDQILPNQKRDLHSRAAEIYERQAGTCTSCGGGSFLNAMHWCCTRS